MSKLWKYTYLIFLISYNCLILYSCQKKINTNDIADSIDDIPIDDTIGTNGDFDTSLIRYYSDINTFGVYIGKSAPTDNIADITNLRLLEPLKRDSAIACAKDFFARYIRLNVFKDLWDDTAPLGGRQFFLNYCKASRDANLAGVININYHQSDFSTPQPYATPEEYSPYFKEVLDSLNAIRYRPAIIHVENEELNTKQYAIDTSNDEAMYRDLQKYIDQLTAAVNIANNYVWWDGKIGVDVTHGGFLLRDINYSVWSWLKNDKQQNDLAEYYSTNALNPLQNDQINKIVLPRFMDVRIKMARFLEDKMNALPIKYVNIHWNEPCKIRGWNDDLVGGTPSDFGVSPDSIGQNVLDLTMLYYHHRMPNKLVMSNEITVSTLSVPLVSQLMGKLREHPYFGHNIVIIYDSDNQDIYASKAFHNTFPGKGIQFSYSMRPNGLELIRQMRVLK